MPRCQNSKVVGLRMKNNIVFVYGASGHAKVVIDQIEHERTYQIGCLVDDNPSMVGKSLFGYQITEGGDALLELSEREGVKHCVIAVGNNLTRSKIFMWLKDNGFKFIHVIHPFSYIGRDVVIGEGTVVMAGAVINCEAKIGENVIINTGATVDHEAIIGKDSHIAPGCHLCGGVEIGNGTLVGAGTTITPGISVGDNVIIGAGSTIIKNIRSNVTVVGSPAREVSNQTDQIGPE